MADIYEKDFEERSQPLVTDFLRLIGGDDDVAYKVLVSDIAKAIIEQYSGSTVAGEAQSIQSALNAIDAGIGNTAMGTTATTVTGAIAEHTDKIGDDAMGTTATTLTGAIGEHSDLIGDTAMGTTASTLTGAIAEHSDLIGDDTMGTTATTLTGAIAEHEQELGDLNSNLTPTDITPVSDYITLSSGFSYSSLRLIQVAPHLALFQFDIAGTLSAGETVIGSASSKVKQLSYGAARISTTSGTFPATMVIIPSGAVRIHAHGAGTQSAGTVYLAI